MGVLWQWGSVVIGLLAVAAIVGGVVLAATSTVQGGVAFGWLGGSLAMLAAAMWFVASTFKED